MSPRLRVGIVDYLNSRPLAWGFLAGDLTARYEPVCESPARVANLLAAGEIDVGLVPSVELIRIPGLEVVPGPCVAAEREVRSVLLVSSVPFGRIRTLALDENSRTSAVLVRILLAELYGVEPEVTQARPSLSRMLAAHDAALVIGDPALRLDTGDADVLDLAEAWNRLAGLPFVFAVWAARSGVAGPGLAADFAASLAAGRQRIDLLAARAGAELDLEPRFLREYLELCLTFDLGERELAGLEAFLRRAARRLGVEQRPLTFVGGRRTGSDRGRE